MMPGETQASVSERLVAHLVRPVDPADRARAALHLLDWIGCALAGRGEPVGRAVAAETGTDPFAFAGRGTAEGVAALGVLGSLLEMDDVHKVALLHPGPVVAAVVAGLPGQDPLAAMVRGYEAMIRMGRSVGPGHYARFHNTGTCGGIGAAVAAAALSGLDAPRTVHAIGHAMSLAGGLWQCRNEPVDTKHLHVAEAARRGVIAARHAGAGLAGPRFILEGPQGFFAGMAPDGRPEAVTAPEDGWLIHQVSFKPWPACRHAHAAIDAALMLRADLAGDAPAAIRIATYADAVLFCDKPAPRTAAEARFSLQHAVAVALRDGAPAVAAFEPGALATYADLRALATVTTDPALTAAYPARFGATVTVETAGGRNLTATVTDAWGDPENPMDAAAVQDKFRRLVTAAGLTGPQADLIATEALSLPDLPDATRLQAALRAIATPDTTRTG